MHKLAAKVDEFVYLTQKIAPKIPHRDLNLLKLRVQWEPWGTERLGSMTENRKIID